MKKLVILTMFAILLAGLALSSVSDTAISIADTSIPHNEVASSGSEAKNSCASATMTITMYVVANG